MKCHKIKVMLDFLREEIGPSTASDYDIPHVSLKHSTQLDYLILIFNLKEYLSSRLKNKLFYNSKGRE